MTSNRFFIQKAELYKFPVLLTGKEHHHLHSVVRMKSGDNIWLFDEQGTEYLARVEFTGRDNTRLSVMEQKGKKEPPVKITLVQSLIKTGRLEFLLQKSTELGADCFLPVISSRSVVKIEGKIEKKLERWSRIVREAAKQSGNTKVPTILPPKPLREVLREDEDGLKIFLNERGGTYLKEILQGEYDSVKQGMGIPSSVRVLIGPEGGWTQQEERDILDHGFKAISLGPQTLRAETAAISCLVLINHFWNL
ncbi:MAG: 16S rRNA (uracil(1498)-N(3))-methyltransferase [Candidatus Aminicenantaceae bacterium]